MKKTILSIIKRYKPMHYNDLPKITIEDVSKAYNNEYIRLLNCLNQIRGNCDNVCE